VFEAGLLRTADLTMMETMTFFYLGFSFLNALDCSQILCDQD
jgi:hypothetical protein